MKWWNAHQARVYVVVELLLLIAASVAALLAPGVPAPRTEPLAVGFTFSQQQATYLDIGYQDAYASLIQLQPAVVRLAAYWNKVESRPGSYDFSTLDWLVAHTPPTTRVVLCLGMKAPRWPEYFIPAWLEQANSMPNEARVSDDVDVQSALPQYIRAVVEHYRDSAVIAYWQVENEPLDPAGPRLWTVGSDVLGQEIALVRKLDNQHRPVVITAFVSTNPVRQFPDLDGRAVERLQAIIDEADIVGLDLYPIRGASVLGSEVFVRWPAFIWQHQLRSVQAMVRSAGKRAWITELQAEPWLVTQVVYLDRLPRREIVPSETAFVLSEIRAGGFESALLWGAEYWYMRMGRFDDRRWWSAAQQLIV
jgi:hypothetical protein